MSAVGRTQTLLTVDPCASQPYTHSLYSWYRVTAASPRSSVERIRLSAESLAAATQPQSPQFSNIPIPHSPSPVSALVPLFFHGCYLYCLPFSYNLSHLINILCSSPPFHLKSLPLILSSHWRSFSTPPLIVSSAILSLVALYRLLNPTLLSIRISLALPLYSSLPSHLSRPTPSLPNMRLIALLALASLVVANGGGGDGRGGKDEDCDKTCTTATWWTTTTTYVYLLF